MVGLKENAQWALSVVGYTDPEGDFMDAQIQMGISWIGWSHRFRWGFDLGGEENTTKTPPRVQGSTFISCFCSDQEDAKKIPILGILWGFFWSQAKAENIQNPKSKNVGTQEITNGDERQIKLCSVLTPNVFDLVCNRFYIPLIPKKNWESKLGFF